MSTSYWGVEHGDEVSKRADSVESKHYMNRPPVFNSRKQNAKAGAIGSGASVGGVLGGGATYVGLAATKGKGLKPLSRAKQVASMGATGATAGALAGGAVGGLSGSLYPSKNSKGAAAMREHVEGNFKAKTAYKNAKKANAEKYWKS